MSAESKTDKSISREAEYCFDIHRFSIYVVPQLHRVLGVPETVTVLTNFWRENKNAGSRQLLEFGLNELNKVLNEKLHRTAEHPTFARMVEYALRDVIKFDPYCKELH